MTEFVIRRAQNSLNRIAKKKGNQVKRSNNPVNRSGGRALASGVRDEGRKRPGSRCLWNRRQHREKKDTKQRQVASTIPSDIATIITTLCAHDRPDERTSKTHETSEFCKNGSADRTNSFSTRKVDTAASRGAILCFLYLFFCIHPTWSLTAKASYYKHGNNTIICKCVSDTKKKKQINTK